MTPSGIDPETVRLVAQCLNHYSTPGPSLMIFSKFNNFCYGSHCGYLHQGPINPDNSLPPTLELYLSEVNRDFKISVLNCLPNCHSPVPGHHQNTARNTVLFQPRWNFDIYSFVNSEKQNFTKIKLNFQNSCNFNLRTIYRFVVSK